MPKGPNHKLTARILAVALVFSLSLAGIAPAFAALDDPPSGTSTTNPNAGEAAWRQGWGNNARPQYELSAPKDWYGYLYTVDREPMSVIDTTTPDAYERAVRGTGTHFFNTLDLGAFYDLDPASNNGLTLFPGKASAPLEGQWYFHMHPFEIDPWTLDHTYATVTHAIPFGYDTTPPAKVTGLTLKTSATGSVLPAVIATTRAHVKWDYVDYDKLAGAAYFRVYVDGQRRIPTTEDPASSENTQGAPWFGYGGTGSVSLEDLAPGSHTVQVSAVDRATNEGPKSDAVSVVVDPDTPTIAITQPTAAVVGKSAILAAQAGDLGGIKQVVFQIDGTTVAVDGSAPFEAAVSTVPFGSGLHTLTATVTDLYGRSASSSKTFRVDTVSPALSRVSAGPSPFYPKKRNKYRDDHIVKFTASEAGVATLQYKTSKGTVYRTLKKNVSGGATSMKWNGKSGGGNMKVGTYSWTLKVTDAAGNVSSTKSGKATVKFYQLKRISGSRVKLVLR